jgi:predicted Zn-ribbon and HTH transcriptional regulator
MPGELVNCECPECGATFQIPLEGLVCSRCPKCNSFEITIYAEKKE